MPREQPRSIQQRKEFFICLGKWRNRATVGQRFSQPAQGPMHLSGSRHPGAKVVMQKATGRGWEPGIERMKPTLFTDSEVVPHSYRAGTARMLDKTKVARTKNRSEHRAQPNGSSRLTIDQPIRSHLPKAVLCLTSKLCLGGNLIAPRQRVTPPTVPPSRPPPPRRRARARRRSGPREPPAECRRSRACCGPAASPSGCPHDARR